LSARSGRSGKNPVKARTHFPLTREALAKLKLKALRRGIWFKDLKREERKLLELTMRVVEKVRSFLLAKLVSRIVSKLCEAMESRVIRLMRTEGRSLAEKISKIGQVWGNKTARSWARDQGFIQFLTVSNLSSFKP
jgi:16S rRNA U516 pseudouridylate synthase RsuA-like enzyme